MSGYNTYEEQKAQVLSKLRLYCARQERCRQDIERKLRTYELPYRLWDEVIAYLIEEGYLNEERFAKAYVSGKFRMNQWGRYKIRQGLKEKGISPPNIRIGLEEIEENRYRETLSKLIQKKYDRLSRDKDNPWKRRQKLMAYCVRKGFEIELVKELLGEIAPED